MFTKRQLEQIHQGKCEGVNVDVYLDPDINEIDMWLVRKCYCKTRLLQN